MKYNRLVWLQFNTKWERRPSLLKQFVDSMKALSADKKDAIKTALYKDHSHKCLFIE